MSEGATLVTGATGFLGSALVAALLERGDDDVIALVRAADGAGRGERGSTTRSRGSSAPARARRARGSAPCVATSSARALSRCR